MLADLIIILISTVSITGQDRACWSKRENTKYHGLYSSSITNLEECKDACETTYIHCWIIYYIAGDWFPCYINRNIDQMDLTKFEEGSGTNSYILDRDCYASTPVRPCWTHKLGLKYYGLYNSLSLTLRDCLDECQTQYDTCFIVNYSPENDFPCWYNHQLEIRDESKFREELNTNTYLIDRSCLTSTPASMATTETTEYDIDECVQGISLCDNRTGNCVNSVGTYICQCLRGFKNSDESWTSCIDIDECDPMSNPCDFNSSTCENSFGSFACRCLSGYLTQPDVPNICIDIDECWLDNLCENETTHCLNIPGSYDCHCKAGFSRLNSVKCADIDECWLDNLCENETTHCLNIPGSYDCHCKAGFSRLNSVKCADIDECTSLLNTCSEISLCINNFGSFICECPEGSVTNKFAYYTECQDIDECSTSHECDLVVSFCLNLIFGYYCQCRVGYTNVNNNSCESIYTNNATTYQEEFTLITTEDSDINSFSALYVILLTVLSLVVLAVSTFAFYKIIIWCGRKKSLGSSISSYQGSFSLD